MTWWFSCFWQADALEKNKNFGFFFPAVSPPPPTGGRNTNIKDHPSSQSFAKDHLMFFSLPKREEILTLRVDRYLQAELSRRETWEKAGRSPRRRREQSREMESERCAPPGALFAVKTTAVISPNRSAEAIIIEHQRALCVHVVHKSTSTHGLSPNNRSKRPH